MSKTQAVAVSCTLVENSLASILKMKNSDEALSALEGFYTSFKSVPGLLSLLASEPYGDLLAMLNCFIDVLAGTGCDENVRPPAHYNN